MGTNSRLVLLEPPQKDNIPELRAEIRHEPREEHHEIAKGRDHGCDAVKFTMYAT